MVFITVRILPECRSTWDNTRIRGGFTGIISCTTWKASTSFAEVGRRCLDLREIALTISWEYVRNLRRKIMKSCMWLYWGTILWKMRLLHNRFVSWELALTCRVKQKCGHSWTKRGNWWISRINKSTHGNVKILEKTQAVRNLYIYRCNWIRDSSTNRCDQDWSIIAN